MTIGKREILSALKSRRPPFVGFSCVQKKLHCFEAKVDRPQWRGDNVFQLSSDISTTFGRLYSVTVFNKLVPLGSGIKTLQVIFFLSVFK